MNDIKHFQISDSAMVLEEQPGKISEAFRLFLQGEGYGKWQTTQGTTHTTADYRNLQVTYSVTTQKASTRRILCATVLPALILRMQSKMRK